MNNKILLGSIIAVVVLVLVSFTGVVGYQTTKSSTIARASPLFSVRSSRAIDAERKEFTCDYVGKGEKIGIPLPKRNESNKLILKVFERLSKMDMEEQKEVMEFIIKLAQKKNYLNDEQLVEFKQLIHKIDDNHEDIKEIMTNFPPTILSLPPQGLCTVDGWTPFCYLMAFLIITPLMIMLGIGAISVVAILIVLLPILIILSPILIILYMIWYTSMGETCEGWCITMYC